MKGGGVRTKNDMFCNTTFIGNEPPFLEVISRNSHLQLVVCKKVSSRAKSFFGSSYDYARRNNIQIISPEDYFNNPAPTELIIVSGYPGLIPSKIINHPEIGIINIHQSFLPAYRGRHPLNWAIINGEKHTGITIHHINERFDDGNIIFQEKVVIEENDNIMDVYFRTVEKGKEMLQKALNIVGKNEFKGFEQNKQLATYFPPRKPEDGEINWADSAVRIRNLIRALVEPYPGAYFFYEGKTVIVDNVEVLCECRSSCDIGKPFVIDGSVVVKTGEGFLKILKTRNKRWGLPDLINLL
jgi:methionyl-tRNA formyltransferase